VGIGASAGGLEAFTEFLKHLPTHTGMALIFAQHLDPRYKSNLVDILTRATELPVREATDGMRLEPDHVYISPANRELAVFNGVLQLMPRAEATARHVPIDTFFRALAEDQREKAIGVILSGTGSDGASGLGAIQAEGGITFAQDQHSAKYPGMPASAMAAGNADFVLPAGEIAEELGRIARHPQVERIKRKEAAEVPAETPDALQKVFLMLRRATGVDFSLYKRSTVDRRIARRLILH